MIKKLSSYFFIFFICSHAWADGVLTAGEYHVCAIKSDGTVLCWGKDDQDGRSLSPAGRFSYLSAGREHTCGIKIDGLLSCWGNNRHGQSSPPPGAFIQVSAGYYHSCGIRTDNKIICWGDNEHGQASPPDKKFIFSAAAHYFSCGLNLDKKPECWGVERSSAITDIPQDMTFDKIYAGDAPSTGSSKYGYACGYKTDGTTLCWGNKIKSSYYAQFDTYPGANQHFCGLNFDGTASCSYYNPTDGMQTFTSVAAGGYFSCGLRINSTIECWSGISNYGLTEVPLDVNFMQPNSNTQQDSITQPTPNVTYAGSPAVWTSTFDDYAFTSPLSDCLDYGETLFSNLGITILERQTYAVLGIRGNSTIVITCGTSSVGTLVVSNLDLTESKCVYDVLNTLMTSNDNGSNSTLRNCPLNTSETSSASATISSDLNIHISNAVYQPVFGDSMNLWADLQFIPGAEGSLMWQLSNYGLNQ